MKDRLFIRQVFKGNENAYGTYVPSGEVDARGKAKGSCKTLPLPEGEVLSEDEILWKNHLDGVQSIGVIPINKQHECFWGCIDIDTYKGFDHRQLLVSIKRAELPFTVFKSKSGGAHVYIFFKNPVKAKALRKKLDKAASLLGFKGQEIFPKQSELPTGFFGNYVNTPYFNADNPDRYAMVLDNNEQVKQLSLQEFFTLYESTLVESIDKFVIKTDTVFPDGPPCNNCIALRGCAEGGRNMYLFNVAVMYKKMYEESGEDWLSKLQEANQKYMTDPLSQTEVSRIYSSVTSHTESSINSITEQGEHLDEESTSSYHYLCKQEPMKSYCNREECIPRKYGVTRTTDGDDNQTDISQIHKVLDDPVFYYVTFENGVVMKAEVDDIFEEKNWRKKVGVTLDFKPARMGADDFDVYINHHMREHLDIMELPEGVGRSNRIHKGVEDWLSGTGRGDDVQGLLQGSSFYDEKKNKIFFKFDDLRSALVSTKIIKDTQRESSLLYDFVKKPYEIEIDGKTERVKNPGLNAEQTKKTINKKTIHVWVVDSRLFDLLGDNVEPKEIIKERAF
tara:strand:+ start:11078 stop:12766 length:1689 start_codon:yes stop_codon:yes gene_type:complete